MKIVPTLSALVMLSCAALASSQSLQSFAKDTQAISNAQAQEIDSNCTKVVADLKAQITHLHPEEQTYKLEVARLDCESENLQAPLSSTQGMLAVLDYIYTESDKLLNKYYKLYRAEFKKRVKDAPRGIFAHEPSIQKGQDTLLEEQRAWLKLRDSYESYLRTAHTHTYAANEGGTIYSIYAASARLAFLQRRVKTLFWRYYAMLADEAISFDSIFNAGEADEGDI